MRYFHLFRTCCYFFVLLLAGVDSLYAQASAVISQEEIVAEEEIIVEEKLVGDETSHTGASPRLIARGAYLAKIGGCVSCHTPAEKPELSGGKAFVTPFGRYYSSNLRSREFLYGTQWDYPAFKRALTNGLAPDGRSYYPVFPYSSFSALREHDVQALFAYLKAQTPMDNEVPAHQPKGLARLSWSATLWRNLFFEGSPPKYVTQNENKDFQEGRYLLDAVLHCGQCHTSRNRMGAMIDHAYLRGTKLPNGHIAPNLTPSEDGLLLWEMTDIQRYLRSGKNEWGPSAKNEMRDYIDTVSRHLSERDSILVAEYLQRMPRATDFPRCRVHGPRSLPCR